MNPTNNRDYPIGLLVRGVEVHIYSLSKEQKATGLVLIVIAAVALLIGGLKLFGNCASYALMGGGAGLSLITISVMASVSLKYRKKIANDCGTFDDPDYAYGMLGNCVNYSGTSANSFKFGIPAEGQEMFLYHRKEAGQITFHIAFYRTKRIQEQYLRK